MSMTIKDAVDLVNGLASEHKETGEGAMDALKAILSSRLMGGGGGTPPPVVEMDPELDKPESDKDEASDDDIDIEDPDGLLDDRKEDGEEIDDAFSKEDKEHRKQIGEATSVLNQAQEILDEKGDELTPEEKKSLEDIIKSMEEIIDSDEPMDADKFNEILNKALDILDKLVDIKYFSDEENEERLAEIERELMDPLEAEELELEDELNKSEDPLAKKIKARDAEKDAIKKLYDKESGTPTASLAKFKSDLKKAIGDQISRWQDVEEPTYSMPDRHHEDDGIMSPATRIDEVPDEDKPSVDVFIDQSGSWSDSDVKIALEAVRELIGFEEQNLLDLNIFYFSEFLSTDRAFARAHGRYECWDLIIEQINAKPKTKNVVMITDHDIGIDWGATGCHGCYRGPGTQVEGCVWFLWKNGSREPMAPAKLRGKQGTFQYQFRS